jgi:ribosomal protein L13E
MGYAGRSGLGGSEFVDFHSRKRKARKTGVFSDDEREEARDEDFEDLYKKDKRTKAGG